LLNQHDILPMRVMRKDRAADLQAETHLTHPGPNKEKNDNELPREARSSTSWQPEKVAEAWAANYDRAEMGQYSI
jgi:hypothetical protein